MRMLRKEVDLIISFGTKDFGRDKITSDDDQAKLIYCGLNTSNIGRDYPFDLAVVGNTKKILGDLIDCVKWILAQERINSIKASRFREIKAYTESLRSESLEKAKLNFSKSLIHPDRLGYEMSRLLEKDAILVSKNFGGSHQFFNFGLRDNEMMQMSNTCFSLGWGVGAAIGAKLGKPERQVVLSIGDGSVMYSASGFQTQARYGIPVLTIVWNNRNYQTVRTSFDRYQGKMAETGQYIGVYLGDPDIDFVKLAESQGVEG